MANGNTVLVLLTILVLTFVWPDRDITPFQAFLMVGVSVLAAVFDATVFYHHWRNRDY